MEDGLEQNNTGSTEASDEYDASLDYNIASEKLSKDILNQLRNNDPKVTSLEVSFGGTLYNNNHICANTVDWGRKREDIFLKTNISNIYSSVAVYHQTSKILIIAKYSTEQLLVIHPSGICF